MKKIVFLAAMFTFLFSARSQDNVYPAKAYKGLLFITNGTVHVGNGRVLENATIEVKDGKIVRVGTGIAIPLGDVKVVDAKGKQVYPGLILPQSDLGLKEISGSVRGSNDYRELGDINPNVRAIVAYNAASTMINVLKANGILLANTVPQGGTISGTSSVVQLDAWNWEDAAYAMDNGIHLNLPSFSTATAAKPEEVMRQALEKTEEIKNFFREAHAYLLETTHASTNLKLEAVKGLFDKSQKLFVHAGHVKQMLLAIDFVKEFGFDVVIVGGEASWQIAPLLKENNIAVILNAEHHLPATEDEDYDQPFKTPAILQKAGVLFSLNDNANNARYRNLAFNAGTAAAFGLTKEEALSAITLNTARILGIDARTGSIEAGKDANIIISEGDILDMRTSIITHAFIQGRQTDLTSKQTQLYERYIQKYGLN
ncbi:amidohydrolase family protein [Agriterribacter sp.]|uniref:amidohydrolase family protein n=1 Tax=Agriterribacter sp. TaxID=2821509 RepID=UPI002C8FE628|nr:amidohydrolase family protein [Agriterribacter sp.]HRO48027.1 amidohydrolase family protein [Agriterribacter sp.]HRQ15751.1 amidohydrolase family protein [Agriterribacter sp.]